MEKKRRGDFNLVLNEQTLPIIQQMAEAMPGGFFVYCADGDEEIIYVNRAVLRIFGCATLDEFKELTGYTFKGMVHPDDIDEAEDSIARQIQESEEKMDYLEYRIKRKDGSIRWIMDYGHFEYTEGIGDLFYVFIDDVTDKYLEQQEEKKKAEVIEGLSVDYNAIYLLDFERNEITPYRYNKLIVNNGEENMECSRDYEWYFRKFAEKYVLPEDREHYIKESEIATIRERLKKEHSYTVSFRRREGKNKIEWEQMYIARLEDENKYTRAVIGYKTITKRVEKIQAATAARVKMEFELDAAKHANQAKSAFLFSISHDIRTPMNAIVGFTRLAKKYINDPEHLADYLDKMEMSNEHLLGLINDVLDMSQIENGQIQIKTEPCNIKEQLFIVLEMLGAQVSEKRLEFSADIDIKEVNVYADPLNLRRIFANVIGNAVKFTPEQGRVKVQVSQGELVQSGYISYRFVISDTGIGMSEEFMQHMFESFEREETSTKSGYQGTGLGLSITKNLVDMMGGSIVAESKKGKGSSFTITLAFKIADGTADCAAGKLENMLDKRSREQLKGKRILVVEDNELNREIAVEILQDAGFKIESATDGCDAVEDVRKHPAGYYDLVLMDIQMPVMNGYDAARAIRAIDRDDVKDLPIVALSANAMKEDKRRSIESGMNGHISKPFDIMNLIETVGDFV